MGGGVGGVLSWIGVGEKPLPAVKLIGLPKVQVGVLLTSWPNGCLVDAARLVQQEGGLKLSAGCLGEC